MDQPINQIYYTQYKQRILITISTVKVFSYLLLILLLSACNNQKQSINIAVASNFEVTLKQIIKLYQKQHNTFDINIIPGSSGMLANQIINKAPFDLFLSADTEKADIVYQQANLTLKPQTYAIGQLTLWIPLGIPNSHCLEQLKTVNTLVIANPKTAPYGSLADKIIKQQSIQVNKVIQSANILQSYLLTKEKFVEAGFVANSQITSADIGCRQVFLDNTLKQSMVLLSDDAKEFHNFILSDEIQIFIAKSGYNINLTNRPTQQNYK
jgi:molybdenum ABC transporter molybdate-binding protein